MSQVISSSRRRRWSEAVAELATGIVPPAALCGGSLQVFFNFSTPFRVFLLLALVVAIWISHENQKTSKHQSKGKGPLTKTATLNQVRENSDIKQNANAHVKMGSLFPSITEVRITTEDECSAKACSTGLTTRLLPFKNKNGEIEWAFTDESNTPGSELDVFKITNVKNEQNNELTPVTSNSSHSDSIISSNNKQSGNDNTSVDTPLTNSPFSDQEDLKGSDLTEMYQCPDCDASFKIRGYLTRHLKKHAVKKAYCCPFYSFSIYVDENNITHKCHPNGGFSRRDTYKTHLKSRHFKYPEGVKTKERTNSPGYCGMCNEYFPNSEIWCEIHVEGGECRHLPKGFTGKSRIKNRLRKQQQKQKQKGGKVDGTVLGSGAIYPPISFHSPSKSPTTYDTPQSYVNSYGNVSNNNNMEPIVMSNSPAYSLNSSDAHTTNYMNTPVSIPSTFQVSPQLHQVEPTLMAVPVDDYDDDYCLDMDQLVVTNGNMYG